MERTYRAVRFDEALADVRRELGPDAVIVDSRRVRSGIRGGRPEVQVTALSKTDAVALGLLDGADAVPGERLACRLEMIGVPARAAGTIARAVVWYHGSEPPTLASARHALARALETEMVFSRSPQPSARVVALVGPTGVGKTTTIAKLAAVACLVEGRDVALVSIDQYRVGGSDQLGAYADLIGIPIEVAHDARSLEIALRRLARAELVLVDTAGRSPRDPGALAEMAETLHGVHEVVEVHLCLAAAMREVELSAAIERHAVLRPVRLISTKLDEALHLGPVIAAHVQSGLPLAWLTTGQRVPEDLQRASAESLAALVCGEEEMSA